MLLKIKNPTPPHYITSVFEKNVLKEFYIKNKNNLQSFKNILLKKLKITNQ